MKNSLGTGISVLAAVALIGGVLMFTGSKNASPTSGEPELQHVHGLAVDVANPNRLLIATHHGLLQLVDDANLSQVGTSKDDFMGFTPHPTNPLIFFSSGHAARGGNLGFQKSTDGGVSWQKVSDGLNGPVDFHSMTVSTVNPDIVYGNFGSLQRSKDGGLTWEVVKGGVQPYALSTDPKRENVVYAATSNGVMMSEDMGDTWKSLSSQLEGGSVSAFAINTESNYALIYSQALGGMGKSIDGGTTWQKVNENFSGEAVLYIAHNKALPSTAYVLTESNSIYKSVDEAVTWSKIR